MSELEPLPHDLHALLSDERQAYAEDPAAKARVLRRLEVAILFAGAAAGTAAVAGSAAGASAEGLSRFGLEAAKQAKIWLALSLATGVVIGEVHGRLAKEPEPAPAVGMTVTAPSGSPHPVAAVSASVALPAPVEPAIAVSALPSAAAPDGGASATPKSSAAALETSDLAAEQRIIDTARSALTRGRGDDALRAATEHERRFSRGRLAEEREMLAIQALLLIGDRAAAETRAVRFRQRYPDSLFRGAVDALFARPKDGG